MDNRGGMLTGNCQVKWYSDRVYGEEIVYRLDMGRLGAAYVWFLLDLCCRDGVCSGHGLHRWDTLLSGHGLHRWSTYWGKGCRHGVISGNRL